MQVMMRCGLLFALLVPASGVTAQSVVIYRCTDAGGALTVQNDVPCPKGSRQERRVIESVPSAPSPPIVSPTRTPSPPVPMSAATPAAVATATTGSSQPGPGRSDIAIADRLPPPSLFECRTYDNGRYLSDDGEPPQRCVPLTTTGIGGGSGPAAGESCQMVSDQCQRIVDGALCENWQARLLEAQAALRFGRREDREAAQAEVDRVERVVQESTCGSG